MLTVGDALAIIAFVLTGLKGLHMFLSRNKTDQVVDNMKIAQLEKENSEIKKQVEKMEAEYESVSKTVTSLDKKLEVSVTHQKNQSEKIDDMKEQSKQNSNKLDRILEAIISRQAT